MTDRIIQVRQHDIDVSAKTTWQNFVITTSDGLTGTGEYTFGIFETPEANARARVVAATMQNAPSSLDALKRLGQSDFYDCALRSAIEQALMDIEAQRQGVPVWRLLNPEARPTPIPLYANINRRTEQRSPDGFASSARSALAAGFTSLKMAPFDGVTPKNCTDANGRACIEAALARVGAVAEAARGRASIKVDCHWRFTPDVAAEVLAELAKLGVHWFECPLPEVPEHIADLTGLRGMANKRDMLLAGLETACHISEIVPYLKAGAYDVIMPDVKYAGGFSGTYEMARFVEKHGMTVSLHNPTGPVAHLASVHVTAAIANKSALELQFDESPLFFTATNTSVPIAAATCPVPQSPGISVTLKQLGAPLSHRENIPCGQDGSTCCENPQPRMNGNSGHVRGN